MGPADRSIEELKSELISLWGKSKELLYHLRTKLKAQGKRGEGFGEWVEENLEISRRTADRWADEYAVSIGEKPFRQNVQKWAPRFRQPDDNLCQVELELDNPEERKLFIQAVRILQREKRLTQVVYGAVLAAAKVKKPNENAHSSRLARGHTATPSQDFAAHAQARRSQEQV
jgi:hypothetical protein